MREPDRTCARCRLRLRYEDCQGESGLYSPNRSFTLCEPCFETEDAEINARGSNEWPERIEEYRQNLRLGSLPFSCPPSPAAVGLGE